MELMQIGELARRTRLSVKTVRYYSDLGLVPEADRTPSGYRRYDGTAVARLGLVRTLRDLGLDLATIGKVLARETELPGVITAHADALGAQIRLLRVQHAALRALARRAATPEGIEQVSRLAQATADERRRLITEFLDSIFEGVNVSPDFEGRLRAAVPELPDDPTDEQLDAWLELAELVRDPDFRDRLRAMGRRSFGATDGTSPVAPATPTGADSMRTAALVAERAGEAMGAGIDPAAPEADATHDALVAALADSVGREADEPYRRELLETMRIGYEPRAERYWQLLAIINGWPPIATVTPAWKWFADAVAARLP
jgi:DNA-binding transcriptional MerR regulator